MIALRLSALKASSTAFSASANSTCKQILYEQFTT
jgi:hypothetical protein